MRLTSYALLGVLATVVSAATCESDLRVSTGAFAADGATIGARAADLVGTWRRLEILTDASGHTRSSERSWSFASDGGAAISVAARDLNTGASDVALRRARWRTEDGVVVIDYPAPDAGTVRLTWSIERSASGTTLFLDGLPYDRVTS